MKSRRDSKKSIILPKRGVMFCLFIKKWRWGTCKQVVISAFQGKRWSVLFVAKILISPVMLNIIDLIYKYFFTSVAPLKKVIWVGGGLPNVYFRQNQRLNKPHFMRG